MSGLRARAFTLIEILVATAIGMALIAAAWEVFSKARAAVSRSQARIELHQTAKAVYETMRGELSGSQNSNAMWVRSVAGTIDLVFMSSLTDDDAFISTVRLGDDYTTPVDQTRPFDPDLVWCLWRFKPGIAGTPGTLWESSGSNARRFQNNANGWTVATRPQHPDAPGKLITADKWLIQAQPRRRTFADDVLRLDDNRFGFFPSDPAVAQNSGNGADLGDLGDLERRLAPIHRTVSAVSIELVLWDGTVRTIDGSSDVAYAFRGLRLDGSETADVVASPTAADRERGLRPALLRFGFSLGNRRLALTQPFSFSFAMPGPAIRQ